MTQAAYIVLCRARAVTAEPILPAGWFIQQTAELQWKISPAPDTIGFDVNVQAMMLQLGATPPRAVYVCTGWAAPLIMVREALTASRGAPGWVSVWTSFAHLREDPSVAAVNVRSAWPDRRHPAAPGSTEIITLHQLLAGIEVSDED